MAKLKFHGITLDDKQLVNGYFTKSNFMGSEYSFPALFIWRHKYNYSIAEYGGCLIVLIKDGSDSYYFYPAGDGDVRGAVAAICRDAQEKGENCYLTAITKENTLVLDALFPDKFKFAAFRDYFDYIYDAGELINLAGRKYHAKRNYINRFIEEYGEIHYEDIEAGNIDECREAYHNWLEEKKDKGVDIKVFSAESEAMKECFEHYGEIGLIGGLVRARGNICSFSFGSGINQNTFGIHVEKSLVDCQGGYAVINREFAAKHASEYKYINREEDLGIKGLRRSKLSYHPVFLLEKYTAALKGGGL